ncbi:MAG: excinuclease ABC subunit UvrA [Planctomycetales bacterium]|nr:excinuclease ABC subunit UvrA [Planctomycetales bacterium]
MSSTERSRSPANLDFLRIRGARTHNLKNVSLDIPLGKLVVITGPSGSGKSSLAFDTIYAEGQRQYIESLSTYARQFFDQLERPDVDSISGLSPVICIDQRSGQPNPRSTVATTTEIHDYLRLLFARAGDVKCHLCGEPIRQQSLEQIQESLLDLPEGTKVMLLAPLVRGKKGEHADVLAQVRKAGLVRIRVDGVIHDLEQSPPLDGHKSHTVEAVVDRLIIREGMQSRLAESLNLAIKHGSGVVIAAVERDKGTWEDRLYSTLYSCPSCGVALAEIEPRTFSFNSPYGACPKCEGLGSERDFDLDLFRQMHAEVAATTDADLRLSLQRDLATATDTTKKEELEALLIDVPCSACHGARLRPEALSVLIHGKNIHQVCQLAVSEAAEFFRSVRFDTERDEIAAPLVLELVKRLAFLERVGLTYITLDRATNSLSGGEFQRVRLATGIGSGLTGILYILDEPSIGLHPRDTARLIAALRELQSQGNTVLVVEHDEAVMKSADWLIDVGPGAGSRGGEIIAEGTPAQVAADEQSLTGRYLSGAERQRLTQRHEGTEGKESRAGEGRTIVLAGVTTNNLKTVTVEIPLGKMIGVSGVSGSGKSSLINETLTPAILRKLGLSAKKPGPFRQLTGVEQIDKLIEIDQSPLGRSPKSNAATYSGVFDEIRKVFAATKEAKALGFRASRFSFNAAGGRCEECQGQGLKKIEMGFMPDLYVRCPVCGGQRFNRQTLSVKFKGKSIADVLAMPVEEGAPFFENVPAIHRTLESLLSVGLGYLPLGQSSTTLSGGEAQRIKLATELARPETGRTLYVLDEPTTGLHASDVRQLIGVLQALVSRGNTVLVTEHNLDVLLACDWLIDLGPEGGRGGGELLFSGPPHELAGLHGNHTGRFLQAGLTGGRP